MIEMERELKIPENVKVEIDDKHVKVSGPKGELEKEFKHFFDIKIEKENDKIVVSHESEKRKVKAMGGTIAAHIRNMLKGVTEGFTYEMKVVYSHFPIKVEVKGDKVLIKNFLGENVPRVAKIVGNTKVEVKGTDITISGIDKEEVGETASRIERCTRIVGKDRRTFMDGIYVVLKG